MNDVARNGGGAGALLQHIRDEGRRQCEVELAASREKAAGIVAAARRSAGELVREAVRGERLRIDQRHAEASSRASAKLRRRHDQELQAMLTAAEPRLVRALEALWQEISSRRSWVARVAEQAIRCLPPADWRVEHPPDWNTAEWNAGGVACGPDLRFAPSADLQAGLRVHADKAHLDGSLHGLLVRTGHVHALLLGMLSEAAGEGGGG